MPDGGVLTEPIPVTPVTRVPFEIVVEADIDPASSSPTAGALALVPITELAIQALIAQLLNETNRRLQSLSRKYQLQDNEFFPELTGRDGLAQHFEIYQLDEWLRMSLVGRPGPALLATWAYKQQGTTPITLQAASVAFERGSLGTDVKAYIEFATLLVAVVSMPVIADTVREKYIDAPRIEQSLTNSYGEMHCVARGRLAIDLKAIKAIVEGNLDYKESGLSESEVQRRACAVQLILSMDDKAPGPIDGDPRRKTNDALERFRAEHHLYSADIRSQDVRAALVVALHKRLRELER